MSLFDELQQEVAKRNPLAKKRAQIQALRAKAQQVFKEQFLVEAMNKEQIAFQKGRIAAFDECLQILMNHEDQTQQQGQPKWED